MTTKNIYRFFTKKLQRNLTHSRCPPSTLHVRKDSPYKDYFALHLETVTPQQTSGRWPKGLRRGLCHRPFEATSIVSYLQLKALESRMPMNRGAKVKRRLKLWRRVAEGFEDSKKCQGARAKREHRDTRRKRRGEVWSPWRSLVKLRSTKQH